MLEKVTASRRNSWTQAIESETVFSMDASSPYIIRDIDGLGPVDNEISRTNNAVDRGSNYRSARAGERNIVIQLGFKPGIEIDFARLDLYSMYMPGSTIELRFDTTHQGPLVIAGVVEKHEPTIWSKEPTVMISIICTDPYFRVDDFNIETYVPPYEDFPQFAVPFRGQVEVGFIVEYELTRNMSATSLFKLPTGPEGFLSLTMDLQAGDIIRFVTIKDERRAEVTRNGQATRVLGYFSGSLVSTRLKPGDNWFHFPDYGSAKNLKFTYEPLIGGI
jgi:hypothetical protein